MQLVQKELVARPSSVSPVSARPEVAEIIQGDQRVRGGLDLSGKMQHQELECQGAKSSGRLGSTGQLLTS